MSGRERYNSPLTCIDLFSGAGGLSCGLEMAGFRVLLASDYEPVFGETYRLNHPDVQFVDTDIRNLSGKKLLSLIGLKRGQLDLLAGGPPCQGFSINAPVRSTGDKRNHLFKEFLRIASDLYPRTILIENVTGIVSLAEGEVVKTVYKALNDLGYQVCHKILFAAHYGVPQMRYRTIFLATRLKSGIVFPAPEYNASGVANFTGGKELCFRILPLFQNKLKPFTSAWDALSDLPSITAGGADHPSRYDKPPASEYQRLMRKQSRELHNHSCNRITPINLERLKHIPQGGSWRDIPFELLPSGLKRARRSDHTKRYGRIHPNELCSTILTKCDPHWGSFFHPYQDRVLSVREAARIQSFPDRYIFRGSRTEQYTQVGNAVPPLLARALGRSVIDILNEGGRSDHEGEEGFSRNIRLCG